MDSSSSDGSFAWTDASSDTIESADKVEDNMNKTQSDDESVSGKSYKKKLQDELFAKSNGDVEEKPHEPHRRKRKLTERRSSTEQTSPKKSKIKMEPESDLDISTNKDKTNGHSNTESYDESYLDLKVKAEEHFTPPSLTKTKKNKSKNSTNSDVTNNESSDTIIENFQDKCKGEDSDAEDDKLDQLVQLEMKHEKKKKKKKKKSKEKEESDVHSKANHTDSQMEDGAINGSDGSPHHSTEESDVTVSKQVGSVNHKIKNKNPSDSRNKDTDRGSHRDSPIIKSTHNKPELNTPISIPERIQFEDDESSDMETGQPQSSETSKKSSKLKTFLKNNLNLKPYTSRLTPDYALTVEDEIWVVRCPKEVDIDDFKYRDLMLDGKCKLKLNSQTYEGIVDTQSTDMSILSSERNHFVIKSLSVKGSLNLRKRIPKTHIQDEALVSNQTNFIPLPETKCRHPLFGANYRKAIKLPAKVSERLRPPSPATSTAAAKKRKHKHVYQSDSDHLHTTTKAEPILEETVELEMNKTDHPVSSKKKKKKRKHSDSEEVAPKKKKRIKHDLESAEAWESEQAIEENLFNF